MQPASSVLGKAAPVATVTVPLDQLQEYTGVYRESPSWKLAFAVENGQFTLKRQGGSSVPLQARSQTGFLAPDSGVPVTFIAGSAGRTGCHARHLHHRPRRPDCRSQDWDCRRGSRIRKSPVEGHEARGALVMSNTVGPPGGNSLRSNRNPAGVSEFTRLRASQQFEFLVAYGFTCRCQNRSFIGFLK